MASLLGIAVKILSKKAGKAMGVGEKVGGDGIYLGGFRPAPAHKFTMAEKIADLKKDAGLTAPYLWDLISQAKTQKSIMPIMKYLQSSRNDLPFNVTQKMLSKLAKKLGELKQQFAAAADQLDPGGWFF